MQRFFFRLRCLVIGCALLECSVASYADSCVMFHKRAPVRAVCGRVINIAGEKLNNVELTLTGETSSALFTTKSDTKGSFSFGSIPKGDYTLHAEAPGYHVAEREVRVTNTNENKCSPKIDVTLGFGVCDTGTRVKGVDKPSDLDSEYPK
jgi:Carboxypeptidase regulatory-like domain